MFHHQVMIAHHHIRIGRRDAKGIHDFLAGLLLVVLDHWHDGFHPLFERRIAGAHQFFVVFDEVYARFTQLFDDGRSFRRQQSKGRFDNGCNDWPLHHAGQLARALDAKLGPWMAGPCVWQVNVHDAHAGQAPHRENTADSDGHQGCNIGADSI